MALGYPSNFETPHGILKEKQLKNKRRNLIGGTYQTWRDFFMILVDAEKMFIANLAISYPCKQLYKLLAMNGQPWSTMTHFCSLLGFLEIGRQEEIIQFQTKVDGVPIKPFGEIKQLRTFNDRKWGLVLFVNNLEFFQTNFTIVLRSIQLPYTNLKIHKIFTLMCQLRGLWITVSSLLLKLKCNTLFI